MVKQLMLFCILITMAFHSFEQTISPSDTASMLSPYLRSIYADARYQSKGNYVLDNGSASSYLPITGGTLLGALSGTSALFNGDLIGKYNFYIQSYTGKYAIQPTSYPNGNYETSLAAKYDATGILTLGNNGVNEIRVGRNYSGGSLKIYTNNTNDYSTSSDGVLALNISNSGVATFVNTVSMSGTSTGTLSVSGTTNLSGKTTIFNTLTGSNLLIKGNDQSNTRLNIMNIGPGGSNYSIVTGNPGLSNIGFAIYDETNSIKRLYIDGDGAVNLYGGIITSTGKFISGSSTVPSLVIGGAGGIGTINQGQIQFGDNNQNYKIQAGADYLGMNFLVNNLNAFSIGTTGNCNFINNVSIAGNVNAPSASLGNSLYIGSVSPSQAGSNALAVNGSAIFTKAIVRVYPWADYVFDEGYNMPSLSKLEKFIKTNHHLPEMPSAADVAKDGIDLGNNQALLLKKIEELTLLLIDQNKQLIAQKKEIDSQKKDMLGLKRLLIHSKQ